MIGEANLQALHEYKCTWTRSTHKLAGRCVPPSNPFNISMFPGTALVQWRRKASKRWGDIMQKTGSLFGDLPKMILLFVNATMARWDIENMDILSQNCATIL